MVKLICVKIKPGTSLKEKSTDDENYDKDGEKFDVQQKMSSHDECHQKKKAYPVTQNKTKWRVTFEDNCEA